jgi:hypothetical protein
VVSGLQQHRDLLGCSGHHRTVRPPYELEAAFAAEYDLSNEPRTVMTSQRWNRLLPVVLHTVREIDPTRVLIVGGANASTVNGLLALAPPPDEHLMVTVHYDEPFRLTHQAAPWEPGSSAGLARDGVRPPTIVPARLDLLGSRRT